jgi:nitrogen-specific signal transduction histidine kinase
VEEPSRDAVEPRAEVTAPSAATVEPPAIRVEPESGSEPDESERLAVESLAEAARPDTPAGDDHGAEATLAGAGWRRLARSLSHEIRNPLVSIRTFAELLPEHFDDETFRSRFTELVGKDVAHISDVLSRLSRVAEREKTELESVDVSSLLEALLEERRPRITEGRLLVLRELERDRPHARADAEGLRIALAGLLDRALESLPERGDLFVATRWIERSADGRSKLRVLLRHHDPSRAVEREVALEELEPTANLLEYVLAEAVVQACGGSLTVDSTDGGETLILIDLPTAG